MPTGRALRSETHTRLQTHCRRLERSDSLQLGAARFAATHDQRPVFTPRESTSQAACAISSSLSGGLSTKIAGMSDETRHAASDDTPRQRYAEQQQRLVNALRATVRWRLMVGGMPETVADRWIAVWESSSDDPREVLSSAFWDQGARWAESAWAGRQTPPTIPR
jgi:hypothetical protein